MEPQTSQPPDAYIHGALPEEQQRLSLLNDLLNDACLRELDLHGGERVLDVGSGLGQFARTMARAVGPDGFVLGIERDADQRAAALRLAKEAGEVSLVTIRKGEAGALPLQDHEWGMFDVVHTRFLLEHLRDPTRAVEQMVRATRPSGRIVLCDDDHALLRLWPEPPGVLDLWQAYYRTYDRIGNDPFIGRRLVALLHAAGAQPVRNTGIFFGSCAGDATFEAFVENLAGVIEGARDAIVAQGLFEAAYFDEVMATFRAWSHRPDAAIWYTLCWAEGIRPKEPLAETH
jgi:ubiquinone/menaquinone biosynthesis C-methylase UbiE